MSKDINIYLVGPMAVGKTTVGRQLAKKLGFEFYDSDQLVEDQTGATIGWIFDIEGEDGFRQREQRVIDTITAKQGIVLATGGGSILTPKNRQQLSARGRVVFLYTDLDVLNSRSRRDDKRPLLRTDDMQTRIAELWAERLPLYQAVADYSLRTTDKSVHQICDEILTFLDH
jgi:shikimate kinase